jgi:hypothetical protein
LIFPSLDECSQVYKENGGIRMIKIGVSTLIEGEEKKKKSNENDENSSEKQKNLERNNCRPKN